MSVHVDAHSFWTSNHDGDFTLNVGRYEEHADGNYYHDYALTPEEATELAAELLMWIEDQGLMGSEDRRSAQDDLREVHKSGEQS